MDPDFLDTLYTLSVNTVIFNSETSTEEET